jgi:chorismate dehydratase
VQEIRRARLGCVKYLNARPLVRGWRGAVEFDHPSVLCRRLAAGELDVALVSSFEYLRNPIYSIVDNVAIASDGPVYSVFVAHRPDAALTEIELDSASSTGVSLLRCLLRERDEKWIECAPSPDNLAPLPPGRARLLIGDQAIRFRQRFAEDYCYRDLGEEWRELTHLPFVYALWLIRPEVKQPEQIADALRRVRNQNLTHLDEVVAEQKEFDAGFCAHYYRDCLRFEFEEREKAGLRLFRDLCAKYALFESHDDDLRVV